MEVQLIEDMERRYMMIRKENQEKTGFQEKMVLRNSINGLIKVSIRNLNGESYYCYDVKFRQNLKNSFVGKPMGFKEVESILKSLKNLMEELERYLLRSSDLLISPDCIFWNLEKECPEFCYYPDNSEGEDAWLGFGQFLLDSINDKDEAASELAYGYFNLLSEGIYSPESLLDKRPDLVKEKEKKEEVESLEDVLPIEKLWEENEDEGFSFEKEESRPKRKKKKAEKKGLGGPLPICLLMVGAAAGLYICILLNPSLLTIMGFSEDSYLTVGAGLALVLSAAILGVIRVHGRTKKKKEGTDEEEDSEELVGGRDYRKDQLEEQYEEERRGKFEKGGNSDLKGENGQKNREEKYESAFQREDYPLSRSWHNGGEKSSFPSSGNYDEEEAMRETVVLTDYSKYLAERGGKASLTGRLNGEKIQFPINKNPFMIGKYRGKADGVISDNRVSRMHACIRKEEGKYFLSDLNSTNGTCLNDRRLDCDETAELHDGDLVKFAGVTMTFLLES
ncbi:MAG: FHA domain-containing protein [Lachnospiraceae bacterium]|nr:FHA domain-containing protein [Lachnospiraceae bacterium]